MHSHLPRLIRALRASFLAVLVLGLMIKPVLAQLSDLHAVEHSVATAIDAHGHDHGESNHGHGDDHRLNDVGADQRGDGDEHSTGAHGLMHQSSGSTTLTGLVPALSVPVVFAHMPDLPLPASARISSQFPTNPFRPPIA